ncbi:hypothetical protein LTR64_005439 [Lithohypha guttulata]|uniref:uncharacterized protein n=1 Tax=Lithohypha guttulata TaxID=1690604 RepID=UPI002DDF7D21|nr:hypothetical protein LTR51_002768 [Lithohypha guttulata]
MSVLSRSNSSSSTERSSPTSTAPSSLSSECHDAILSRARSILSGPASPISQLHELYQFRIIHTLSFKDDGPVTGGFACTLHVGYESEAVEVSFTGSATSKKVAKRNVAEAALKAVSDYILTSPSLTLHAPLQPENSTAPPSASQIALMEDDRAHLALLRELANTMQEPGHKLGLPSIDLEQWERDHKVPLEVGLAFTSCTDIISSPAIEGHHIIVRETEHITNSKFVEDNKTRFLFGKSDVLAQADLALYVSSLIGHYSSTCDEIILVGHTIASDLKWLGQMGIAGLEDIVVMDIGRAYRAITSPGHYANMKGMEKIMGELGLPVICPHNGGNDSVYNLQVLFALVQQITESGLKIL